MATVAIVKDVLIEVVLPTVGVPVPLNKLIQVKKLDAPADPPAQLNLTPSAAVVFSVESTPSNW